MKPMLKTRLALAAAPVLLGLILPGAAMAHRPWMLPSSTVLSGDDSWVTIDAAVSNDLFYFDHQPMRLDNVKVVAPDGSDVAIENGSTGRYRSVFDVHLTKPGTYKIVSATVGLMGSYKLNGEEKRLPRGTTAATLAQAVPAGATDVQTAEFSNRNEVFVTLGEPTTGALQITGKGLEMLPVTHPNDLISGESATFQFLLDGKPAADLAVTVIPGGVRYRDAVGEIDAKTDAQGKATVTWPNPGMYWMNASIGGGREGGGGPSGPGAGGPGAGNGEGPPRPMGPPQRRAGYVTTLEVLAP